MRLLVTGGNGKLGAYVARAAQDHQVQVWGGRGDVDLASPGAIRGAFGSYDAVIHTAAMSAVGESHADPERAMAVNRDATALLAELSPRLVYTSTDLVFDGEHAPYAVGDEARPLSVYGRSKLAGEEPVLAAGGVVARVSLMQGYSLGAPGFYDNLAAALQAGKPVYLFEDEWRTPLSFEDAARSLVELALGDFQGLVHLGGPERLSRYEMGLRLARELGADESLVVPTRRADFEAPEPRPRDVSLVRGARR